MQVYSEVCNISMVTWATYFYHLKAVLFCNVNIAVNVIYKVQRILDNGYNLGVVMLFLRFPEEVMDFTM